ncbi:hypothetical protein D3C75_1121550 [compost metagenome]
MVKFTLLASVGVRVLRDSAGASSHHQLGVIANHGRYGLKCDLRVSQDRGVCAGYGQPALKRIDSRWLNLDVCQQYNVAAKLGALIDKVWG